MLDQIIDEQDKSKEIDEIDDYLLNFSLPKEFTGSKGQEVAYVKQYEKMSLTLTKYIGTNSKHLTVLEYYNAFSEMKKEFKRMEKRQRKK